MLKKAIGLESSIRVFSNDVLRVEISGLVLALTSIASEQGFVLILISGRRTYWRGFL